MLSVLFRRGIWRGEADSLSFIQLRVSLPTASVMAGGFCLLGEVACSIGRMALRPYKEGRQKSWNSVGI
jgi:hypothetical protein